MVRPAIGGMGEAQHKRSLWRSHQYAYLFRARVQFMQFDAGRDDRFAQQRAQGKKGLSARNGLGGPFGFAAGAFGADQRPGVKGRPGRTGADETEHGYQQ